MICDDKTLVNWHWSWFLSLSEFHISRLNICDIVDIVNIVNIVLLFLATTCFGQNFGKSKLIALKIHFVFGLNHLWRHHVGHESFVWTHLFCGVHGKGGGQWGRDREVSKQKLLLKRLLTIFTLFWKSFWRSSWQRNCVADFKKNLWPGIWN